MARFLHAVERLDRASIASIQPRIGGVKAVDTSDRMLIILCLWDVSHICVIGDLYACPLYRGVHLC
jgi:hypothetical protein